MPLNVQFFTWCQGCKLTKTKKFGKRSETWIVFWKCNNKIFPEIFSAQLFKNVESFQNCWSIIWIRIYSILLRIILAWRPKNDFPPHFYANIKRLDANWVSFNDWFNLWKIKGPFAVFSWIFTALSAATTTSLGPNISKDFCKFYIIKIIPSARLLLY